MHAENLKAPILFKGRQQGPPKNSILLIAVIICAISLSSCASKDNALENVVIQNEFNPAMAYSLANDGIVGLKFLCESHVFNYARSKVKDDVLRNQLANTKFIIEWRKDKGMNVYVKNIPTLADPAQHEKLMSVIDGTKGRIKGSFLMAHYIFDGFENIQLDEKEVRFKFSKHDNYIVLSSVRVNYENPKVEHTLEIDYKTELDVLIPHKFGGIVSNGSDSQEDTITVVGATFIKDTKS
jgi:hypothetical protein